MFRKKIKYTDLKKKTKQKETYNFQKASSIFADYGYTTIKLSDDWMGADFIAISFDGLRYLRVQLKTALTFDEKYKGKDLHICFFERKGDEIKNLYLYPHDELLEKFVVKFGKTVSWKRDGRWFWGNIPKHAREVLKPYLIM